MKIGLQTCISIAITALALSAHSQPAVADTTHPPVITRLLSSMDCVTKTCSNSSSDKTSINGQVYDGWIRNSWPQIGSVTYDLSRSYRSLECWIGIQDDSPPPDMDKPSEFAVMVDGDTVKAGTVSSREKAVHIALDVSGARSFCVTLTNGATVAGAVVSNVPMASLPVPNIIAPVDDSVVNGSSLVVQWSPVTGATGYGIQAVLVKRLHPSPTADVPLSASYVKGNTTAAIDVSQWPEGKYAISVMAFDAKGSMGRFSDRTVVTIQH